MAFGSKRWRSKLKNLGVALEFVLKNFAAPIAFFWMFQIHGAKPAIALAIIVTGLQLLAHWIFRLKISPFFLVASGFTVLFGCMDLMIQTPRFFRLEPFAQNALMGTIFLVTVFTRMPIALWFAGALPEKIRPKIDESSREYMRKVTLAWSIYFFVKGLFFLWLALRVDLGRLVILRSIVGGASLAIMFGGELAYRKYFRRGRI